MMDKQYGVTDLPSVEELDKLLSKTKGNMFYQKGAAFLAVIMCSVEYVWDEKIPTACTNGKYIRWNPYFFYSLDKASRIYVLAHELWHIAYQHIARLNGRNPIIANIAADHIINTQLNTSGYSKNIPFSIYEDMRFNGLSFEKVYEMLIDELPPNGGIGGKGLADDLDPKGAPSDLDNLNTIVQAVQASKMAGEAGVIPGEIEEIIERFLNPILPWELILQQFMTEMANDDWSYRRPNRRSTEDIILPTLYSDGSLQEMNWYLDVSGSINMQMIIRFFSEMIYVKETLYPTKINIIQFDTRITKVTELEDGDSLNDIKVLGRGGTNLEPVYEHIQKTKPNAAVIFSDMECSPMKEVAIPVLWCVFCEGRAPSAYAHEPTFGQVIRVCENDSKW